MLTKLILLRILLLVGIAAFFIFLMLRLRGAHKTNLTLPPAPAGALVYPASPRGNVVDDYHGTKVPDPYRWLEDPNSQQTKDWVTAQNKVTKSYLDQIPERQQIRDRLTRLWNYERYSAPWRVGNRYFYFHNSGLQNQAVLYTSTAPDAPGTVLLDPNQLHKDGTVALSGYSLNEDATLLAYGVSTSGSDWQEWRLRDVATGKDLDDLLKWAKFTSPSWTKDGKGFYYSRYPEPKEGDDLTGANFHHKLYYHRIGTPQSADELVYERPDQKEWGFHGGVSEDGRYLLIHVSHGTDPKNRLFYKDLTKADSKVVELLNKADAQWSFLGNDGAVFYLLTDLNAPRRRIVAIDTSKSSADNLAITELLPEAGETIEEVSLIGDRLIVTYLKDATSKVMVFDLNGRFVRAVVLPGPGTAAGFGGRRQDKDTYYTFTSYTTPTSIYSYNIETGESRLHFRPKVDFDPDLYVCEQVFYISKDGTRVPMLISYKKGLKRDGSSPAYLYGYGGFNVSLTPYFSVSRLVWMEMGGIVAVPNLRGGGEYGEKWHQAGTKLLKQNVFDDFIAAAEYLIANKYTSSKKLAIAGGSNGGLLVGAVITQRPELFAAALPAVGVMDMLRFHKFTVGRGWVSDYGSSDDPLEFKALYAYSPYHNLKPGTVYPATLVTTGDHDDRVVPAHSYKFAAALQWAHAGSAPVLIRIDVNTGHGAGKPTTKLIEEVADEWGFLVKVLEVKLSSK